MASIAVFTDGGSRGNPGQAGVGYLVYMQDGTLLHSEGRAIGISTNNEAEYQAVLDAIEWITALENQTKLKELVIDEIVWQLDSKLVVEQVSKRWKIKEPRLQALAKNIWEALATITQTSIFMHIPREQNTQADALVNQALDASQK